MLKETHSSVTSTSTARRETCIQRRFGLSLENRLAMPISMRPATVACKCDRRACEGAKDLAEPSRSSDPAVRQRLSLSGRPANRQGLTVPGGQPCPPACQDEPRFGVGRFATVVD